jgi:hypothetical protein
MWFAKNKNITMLHDVNKAIIKTECALKW